jgi:hypothetical protein
VRDDGERAAFLNFFGDAHSRAVENNRVLAGNKPGNGFVTPAAVWNLARQSALPKITSFKFKQTAGNES